MYVNKNGERHPFYQCCMTPKEKCTMVEIAFSILYDAGTQEGEGEEKDGE